MSRRGLGAYLLPVYAVIAFVYLLTPIAYTVVFSFNDSTRSNLVWQGFTLDHWLNPCGAPEVCGSVVNSLLIGAIATVASSRLEGMWVNTIVFTSPIRFASHAAPRCDTAFASRATKKSPPTAAAPTPNLS